MFRKFYEKFYPKWKNKYGTRFKLNRLQLINKRVCEEQLFSAEWLNGKKILEMGCGTGKDFLQFFKDYSDIELVGIDIKDQNITQENCKFMLADGEELPFEDNYFDLTVSFGVLEHIQPVEKLCKVIREIDRVSKSYAIVVPNISTLLEPHTVELFWQLRAKGRKKDYGHLNYYIDDTWLQFEGFNKAKLLRFNYIYPLITNTLIYKTAS